MDILLTSQQVRSLFSLYGLDANNGNACALLEYIRTSKAMDAAVTEKLMAMGLRVSPENVKKLGNNQECLNYTAPFPGDFFSLNEVKTLRPEYLVGTWFNRQSRPFKLNMKLDWVSRMAGTNCYMPGPMNIWLFGSTGDHIWDFISEIHVHRTAMMEFSQPRDGWIEAPDAYNKLWNFLQDDSPLNFIERMIQATGSRSLVLLKGGLGGWATFERTRNTDLTAAAAMLLFKFSDPLYCARSDGKVVIKFKDGARAIMKDKSKFPSRRTLVTSQNKFPSCIP